MNTIKQTFYSRGFSLIELLVVIAIFVALAIVATQIIAITISGSRKTESLTKVRENVDYAYAVMERQLRNAQSVNCSTSNATQLNFVDEDGVNSSFQCAGGTNGRIELNGDRLTADNIYITCNAVFTCNNQSGTTPPSVDIDVSARSAEIQDDEGARVTTTTKIILRSF